MLLVSLVYHLQISRTMDSSDPLPLGPVNNSCFTKMKETTPMNKVMTFKGCNMQRILQVVQRVAQKSCRRACQMFCCPIDTLLSERATCCPVQDRQPTQAKSTQVAPHSPPSTILIVNISNSNLINCIIGNDAYPFAVAESLPLMQESALHMPNHMRCSCSRGQQRSPQTSPLAPPPPPSPPVCPPLSSQELPRINIHSSHLNFVIIGDNNYMHAEQDHLPETEQEM